jgi:Leucine-rich repeat (LRR) protein
LESIDECSFCCLVSLEKLFLNRNSLFQIDLSVFDGLAKLEILRLDMNRLRRVTNSKNLTVLTSLTTIHLQWNAFTFIQSFAFSSMKNLANLLISNNPLNDLEDKAFYGLKSIESLFVRNCSMNELNEHTFESMINLNRLSLKKCSIFHSFIEFTFGFFVFF